MRILRAVNLPETKQSPTPKPVTQQRENVELGTQNSERMPDRPALSDVVEVVDPVPYWALIEERFGIPPAVFDGWALVRPQSKKLYLVPEDHAPPARPTPETVGLPFLRVKMKYPKLTTAAAMQFGRHATRNVIEATAAQAAAYLTRQPFSASAEVLARCTGRGYVLVRHAGWTLGVGFLAPGEDGGGTVRSMFPKGWAREAEALAAW